MQRQPQVRQGGEGTRENLAQAMPPRKKGARGPRDNDRKLAAEKAIAGLKQFTFSWTRVADLGRDGDTVLKSIRLHAMAQFEDPTTAVYRSAQARSREV